jgi:hypothetical protein
MPTTRVTKEIINAAILGMTQPIAAIRIPSIYEQEMPAIRKVRWIARALPQNNTHRTTYSCRDSIEAREHRRLKQEDAAGAPRATKAKWGVSKRGAAQQIDPLQLLVYEKRDGTAIG